MQYSDFIESKILTVPNSGLHVTREQISSVCFPHQADVIQWALEGGCRAIFCSFGLGKTVIQLEIGRLVSQHTGRPFLVGLPLGVIQEFREDAAMLGISVKYVQEMEDIHQTIENLKSLDTPPPFIYLSNYERIREGKFNPEFFGGVSFDEGDAMRNLDTQTTDYIMKEFSKVPFKFLATATPTPNDYTEILNYAQFLGIMDRSQALTRFFQRNSQKAGDLTIYPHKEQEFWLWVRSWAIFLEYPSDLGHSDDGYLLPELTVHYHEVKVTGREEIYDRDGNMVMFADASKGLSEVAKEKRQSLNLRVVKAVELVNENPNDHFILWHDLEDERKSIEKLLPDAKSVFGSQKQSLKEEYLIDFKHGNFQYLATKPSIAGSGCNFQNHCHKAIFCGVGYKFKDFIQALHRIYRFGQKYNVEIHIIYTDAEHNVLKVLQQKWNRHNELVRNMRDIVKKFGLSHKESFNQLKRKIGVERKEESGASFKCIHNDAVLESQQMEENSVGMILTSIPFSDQYEYCEIYNDMGHNDGDIEFFAQMDFLTPNLLRVLKPGRIAVIHVKDRIRFSYQNGVGFTSLNDFSGRTVAHFEKHGFYLLGKHVITTDVVRENNQTYRLGWTENSKDGTKMGAGSPEYLLVFRKAPTDISNAYADEPVTKSKEQYTRARWQIDAHAYWRSSGNRLLDPQELRKMDLSDVYKAWKAYTVENIYNYEQHVEVCDKLDSLDKLPSDFMAVPTMSVDDTVWDDVNRMNTLNTTQSQRKQEKHVCPLQFDIIDRALVRYSRKGDVVYDPFGGIMSVPFRCIPLERYGLATELNEQYWRDGVKYCKEAEYKNTVPTLFDALKIA
jgi:hypothetical protein